MARPSKRKRKREQARAVGGASGPQVDGYEGPRWELTEAEHLIDALVALRERRRPGAPIAAQARLLADVRRKFDRYELAEIDRLRSLQATWAEIGLVYGVTAQGAQQRVSRMRKRVGGRALKRGGTPPSTPGHGRHEPAPPEG